MENTLQEDDIYTVDAAWFDKDGNFTTEGYGPYCVATLPDTLVYLGKTFRLDTKDQGIGDGRAYVADDGWELHAYDYSCIACGSHYHTIGDCNDNDMTSPDRNI